MANRKRANSTETIPQPKDGRWLTSAVVKELRLREPTYQNEGFLLLLGG